MNQMPLDHFLQFKYVSNLQTSPNGKRLAFIGSYADVKKNDYKGILYTVEKGKTHRLIRLKDAGSFVFETDDTILIPITKNKREEKLKKEQKTVYYRYNFATKKIALAYIFNAPLSVVKTLVDGRLLLQGTLKDEEMALLTIDDQKRKGLLESLKKEKAYEEIDEVPFYFNGSGFTANRKSRLFMFDPKDESLHQITDENFTVEGFSVHDKAIYYYGYEPGDVMPLCHDMYRYDLKDNETTHALDNDKFIIEKIELVGDRVVVLAQQGETYGLNQDPDFYELKDGVLEMIAPFGFNYGNSIGSDVRYGSNPETMVVNDELYFVETVDDHTDIIKLEPDGQFLHVCDVQGAVDGLAYFDGEIYLVALYRQKLQELYRIYEDKITQVSKLNSSVLRGYYVAKPKRIEIKQGDHDVTGFVLLPKDYDSEQTYPAILDIHGGPKTAYGQVYFHEMQYWANEGYLVFYCNPTGSDGKGGEFADIRGKYGTVDYDDIMAFTDKVLRKYKNIDKERLYVTGGSYGGFMTNWIVGHTNIFKAAATQRSISNWVSFYATSDIGVYFASDQNGAHPFTDLDKLWFHSPLKYIQNVETPLLIIHSGEDYRCPIEQAMQMFVPLKKRGVDTKFVWFKGETHELSRSGKPLARIKRLKEITGWFETHR